MSPNVNISLKISSIMPSSSRSFMNCSVSSLSCFYVHILLFLFSFQCYSDITILLCLGFNLLFNIKKGPFVALHSSFSSWVNVYISCRPSWLSQCLITGTSSSSASSYAFISRMFLTSISKFIISTHLSWTFQRNEGFSSTSLPCLCPCGSLWLGIGVGKGSCICIFECYYNFCCCLYSHLINYLNNFSLPF